MADQPAEPVITESPFRTPVVTTVTAQPTTSTVTVQPLTSHNMQGEDRGSSAAETIGVLLGVLAALGIGAGSVFFAYQNGLI